MNPIERHQIFKNYVTWAGGDNFTLEITSRYSSFTDGVADIYSEFELPYNGNGLILLGVNNMKYIKISAMFMVLVAI